MRAMTGDVVAAHGALDGLLNVAGIIQHFVPLADLEVGEIERVMNVNFWGVVHTTQAALPHLLTRPEACVVNVSSMGAFAPVPGQTAYGASKAAVMLLTEGLYAELRGTPVAVTVVFPGAVRTAISENSGVTTPGTDAGEGFAMTSATDAAGADRGGGREGQLPRGDRQGRAGARPAVAAVAAAGHGDDRAPDGVAGEGLIAGWLVSAG